MTGATQVETLSNCRLFGQCRPSSSQENPRVCLQSHIFPGFSRASRCPPLTSADTFPQRVSEAVSSIPGWGQRTAADVRHRPCCLVGAGCALVSLSLTCVRERSAERRYVNSWHLCEGAACFAKHARLPALHWWRLRPRDRASGAGRALPSPLYPGRFPRRSSGPVQPLKAALVVERTVTRGVPGRCLRNTSRRRHTRLHQPDAPRRRPQLSKAWRQYRV